VRIALEDPGQRDIRALLAESDAFYAALYPGEGNYLLDVAALQRPEVSFYVAREEGLLLGFGALVEDRGWAEIKRMYVSPSARGRGIGRLILEQLEQRAASLGVETIRLESGVKQVEALQLYRSAGYRETGPFGSYAAHSFSVFMEKALSKDPGSLQPKNRRQF
jgi:putative acetyltransferase